MNPCTPSFSQTPFVLSDLQETLMAGFAFRSLCWTKPLILFSWQAQTEQSYGALIQCPCAAPLRTAFGFTVFVQRQNTLRQVFLNLDLQEHAGTLICMWYSRKKLLILRKNPKQIRSGASVLHLIFLHPIKTLFSAKLDFKPVTESLVVACSCTSRRADRPMLKDDQLTAFRGVSDSVQHVSFAYVSQ